MLCLSVWRHHVICYAHISTLRYVTSWRAYLQEGGSLASSGIASPAKSESSDDMGFSQSPDSQVMQQQMDWLLLKLITSSHTSSAAPAEASTQTPAPEVRAEANGNSTTGASTILTAAQTARAEYSQDNQVEEASSDDTKLSYKQNSEDAAEWNDVLERQHNEVQTKVAAAAEPSQQLESLTQQLREAQVKLEASQAVAADAFALRHQLNQLQSKVTASEQQAAQSEHLREQVSQLQQDLQSAQQLASSLQKQLDTESQGPISDRALHSRSSSRAEMDLAVSRTESQLDMDQPSASMSIAESDLVEAASYAIQAQASASAYLAASLQCTLSTPGSGLHMAC